MQRIRFSRRTFMAQTLALPVGWSLASRGSLGPVQAPASGPIDESGFVSVGGIDQWIAVQGQDRRNPALLYLHGGPAEAQSPFLAQFIPWAEHFTVVNWDQRGSGRTYRRHGASTPDLTLERLINDTVEIAESLRSRLSTAKVILVGQSWGSFLGVHVVRRRPDLFHAFVGTGQFVSLAASLPSRVQWTRQQATSAGDRETLAALDEALAVSGDRGPLAVAGVTNKYALSASDLAYASIIRGFASTASGASSDDAAAWNAGAAFSGPALLPTVLNGDLVALGLEMSIPFFVIQGRDDHVTPVETARAYFDEVQAPVKAFVSIDGGHYACFTNARAFVAALDQHVRPLAV